MFGSLRRTGLPLRTRIAALTGLAVALTACACACADRRRNNDIALRGATPPAVTPAQEPTPPPVTAPVPARPAAPKEPTCGQAGGPECPLQAWMDARLNTALSTADYPEVARALRELAADRPDGFPTWITWTESGAAAADRKDDAAIRKSCNGCHDDTRETYRRTIRDRPMRAGPAPTAARPETAP
jgi:hypothetical protein